MMIGRYKPVLSGHFLSTFMRMVLLVGIGSVLALIFFYTILLAENSDVISFDGLRYGPYDVGYMFVHEYDYSRTFKPKRDFEGNPTKGEIARPIQIQIWYPADVDDEQQRMMVIDYFRAVLSQFDFSKEELARSDKAHEMARALVARAMANTDRVDDILSAETRAVMDASPQEGNFPLILYGPGGDLSPWDNTVMFEYLASHGYVVAASPTFFAYEGENVYNTQRLESRVRDFEFVLARMLEFPSVDRKRVAALGWSWGGISAATFAMRNHMVSAVACLDGSMAYEEYSKPARQHFDYDFKRIRVPFLFLSQKEQSFQNLGFFDELLYSNAYLFRFNDLIHTNFSSGVNWQESVMPDAAGRLDFNRIELGYETVCRYLLEFFNGYLMDDESGRRFLAASPEDNGTPDGVVTALERKEAHMAPPSESQFFSLIRSRGAHVAADVYRKAVEIDPGLVLFGERRMNETAYNLISEGKGGEAVDLFKLNIEAYPESWIACDGLGAAYEATGDPANAREAFNRSLELNPDNRVALAALERLEGVSPALNADNLKKYAGEYFHGEMTISIEAGNGYLLAGVEGLPPVVAVPAGEHVFVDPKARGYSVEFKLNASGEVEGAIYNRPDGAVFFERKKAAATDFPKEEELPDADLDIYVGSYSSSYGGVEVGLREGKLILLGNPPAVLTQVAPHQFRGMTPVGLTTIEFVLDDTGKVIKLIAHTPKRDFEFERK